MVTKTIPSKPKASKMEAELANEEESLTPEQEAEAREKAKSLVKKLADDKGKLTTDLVSQYLTAIGNFDLLFPKMFIISSTGLSMLLWASFFDLGLLVN